MDENKSDFRKGLIYFGCLMFCICLFFKTPDGDTLLYKILGLLGIKPGITIGNGTLYVYMLVPFVLVIVSIKKIIKYWWGYGSRFKDYNFFLRYLPVLIVIAVFLVPSKAVTPSVVDMIYYDVIGQRGGLQSITYHTDEDYNNLKYEYNANRWDYSYELTFENHSNEAVAFYVKLAPNKADDYLWSFQEVFIKEHNGEKKKFMLQPKERILYTGKFTEYHQTDSGGSVTGQGGGGSDGMFSVVLVNDDGEYSPKPIRKK